MKKILKAFSFLLTLLFLEGVYSRKKTKNTSLHLNTTPVLFKSTPLQKDDESVFSKNTFLILGILFSFLFILFYSYFSQYSSYLKSSTFNFENIEFEGTEFPIKKVPNWVALSDSERKMNYESIPTHKIIDIPEYNIQDFQQGKVWRANNERQRNAYITYPVPNLGNYKLDGTEGNGSHPGIDIKVPINTPVHAFANGIVTKVEYQKTGFGKFVLIAHPDFPDPHNSREKILVYSLYAHLSSQLVKQGDIVKKGQIIGKSGNTGMATAPHLHFQLERETAPFHPYWPFTWSDLQAAGISSYFGAVNSGFNRSNAQKYTLHPVETDLFSKTYISSLKKENTIITASKEVSVENKIVKTPEIKKEEEKKLVINTSQKTLSETKTIPRRLSSSPSKNIEIITNRIFIPGEENTVQIKASNEILLASSEISISSTLRDYIQITPSTLFPKDFNSEGIAEIRFNTDKVKIFKLIANTEFGEVKSTSLLPQVFVDVARNHAEVDAISFLKEKGIVRGYEDGTFKPDGNLTRAEAVKILMEANNFRLVSEGGMFSDVNTSDWYSSYVATAFKNNILKGYPDGTFGPGKKISRAEFLKIALISSKTDVGKSSIVSHPDVSEGDWFYDYFQFSKEKNLILPKRGGFISPHQPITRSEAARIIWMLSRLN